MFGQVESAGCMVCSSRSVCSLCTHQSSGSGPGFGGPIARKNQSVRLFSRCEHRKKDDIHHWKMIFPLNNCRFGRLSSYHPSTLEFQITTRNPLVPTVGWRVPVLLILLPLFAFTAVTGRFVHPPFNCLIDGYGKVGSSQCGSGSCSEFLARRSAVAAVDTTWKTAACKWHGWLWPFRQPAHGESIYTVNEQYTKPMTMTLRFQEVSFFWCELMKFIAGPRSDWCTLWPSNPASSWVTFHIHRRTFVKDLFESCSHPKSCEIFEVWWILILQVVDFRGCVSTENQRNS